MHSEVELYAQDSWRILWLGRVGYRPMLARQEALVTAKISDREHTPDTLLLLEHEPVYTIGRTQDRSSLASQQALPFPVETIHRGGQGTYHGPGQLIGYPIIDLTRRTRDLHRYLRALEEVLIQVLAVYAVPAQRREGLTGVWVGDQKIASIGVGVRHWITLHGFALNVLGGEALKPFDAITPCGLAGITMTAVENHNSSLPATESVARTLAGLFPRLLDARLPRASEPPGQREDDQDDEHQAQSAARTVTPAATVRPGGDGS